MEVCASEHTIRSEDVHFYMCARKYYPEVKIYLGLREEKGACLT